MGANIMKVALITGGSRGIGRAMVELFSKTGYSVAFTYKSSHEAAAELSKRTGALAINADSANPADIERAVKTVEECMDKVVSAILAKGGSALITADHGNADKMFDENGKPFTAHTTNVVPFILVSEQFKNVTLRSGGILADIAPTLLEVMDVEIPAEMTGKSLIEKN